MLLTPLHSFFSDAFWFWNSKSQTLWLANSFAFKSNMKMTLSLHSPPVEVDTFVEAHGLSPKPFLEAKVTGAFLGNLSGHDMVSGGFCTLLGGLRIVALAHLQFGRNRPSCAVVRVQDMDSMLMYAWLHRHGQVDTTEKILSRNICGMGVLLVTPEIAWPWL